MASTLAWHARDVCSIPALGTIFPNFILSAVLVAMTMTLYKLCNVWLLNLAHVCEYIRPLPVYMQS